MERDEHLAWCKKRALEYVERGNCHEAVSSMLSDLGKHEAFRGGVYDALGFAGLMEISKGPAVVRYWIEGFN